MLDAAATTIPFCELDGCAELATRQLSLSHRGSPITFAVCTEHHHDIDWGCIRRNSWLRSATVLPPPTPTATALAPVTALAPATPAQ